MTNVTPQRNAQRAPPGWYPDPTHPEQECYWDGSQWHPEWLSAGNTVAKTGVRRPWVWLVAGIATLALVVTTVFALLLIAGGSDPTEAPPPTNSGDTSWTGPTSSETAAVVAANPGIFSSVVTGSNFASMVQLQGDTVTRWQYIDGDWRAGSQELYDGISFTAVETVDVTDDGVLDYFMTSSDSDGYVYGSVLVTQGGSILYSPLIEGTESYGSYSPLSVDPDTGSLISDLAGTGARGPGDPPVLYWTYDPQLVQFTLQD